jgi:hypothetical protein
MGARAATAGISGNITAAFTQHSAVIVRVSMICMAGDLFSESCRPGLLAPQPPQRFRLIFLLIHPYDFSFNTSFLTSLICLCLLFI